MPSANHLGAYRGRFAPSPSGPLHFGSLVAAVASYLDAKAHHGKWLVRMEDIDTPRVVAGSDTLILKTLEAYGLHWDENVEYQSQRHSIYQATLSELVQQKCAYGCECTRKQIKLLGGFYNNHCRNKGISLNNNAIRIKQTHPTTEFDDLIKGAVQVDAHFAKEDFIIKRRDNLFAYQLVVVLDDIEQGITHIVRGADLVEPTVRQISLFQQLKSPVPAFAHIPLAVAEPGFKLSKQNHAPSIDLLNPLPNLMQAFDFLGLPDNHQARFESCTDALQWAVQNWHINHVPKVDEIQVTPTDSGFKFTPLAK